MEDTEKSVTTRPKIGKTLLQMCLVHHEHGLRTPFDSLQVDGKVG